MGAVNFYQRFVPAAAKILLPLTAVLKGRKKGAESQAWSPMMLTAFSNIKAALLRSVCLAFPKDNAELSLATDASATHMGAVLQQKETPAAAWRPLGFFSAKLEQAQLSYSAFDRELYGILLGYGISDITWKAASSLSGPTTIPQGWEFAHFISERIAHFLSENEQMSESLKK